MAQIIKLNKVTVNEKKVSGIIQQLNYNGDLSGFG